MKRLVGAIMCLGSFCAGAENLLANPGFDVLTLEGMPAQWNLFVMPDNGALGQSDTVAHDGGYAAMLHTPKRYAEEPLNNWSQVIYDDLVGKEVTLTAHIRTENVQEASVWIQCFRKQPLRLLAKASSQDEYSLSGTNGWTRVETSLVPPNGTDFLVIRCLIAGQGMAWFDSLSLAEAVAEAAPLEEMEAIEAIEVIEPVEDVVDLPALETAEPAVDAADVIAVSEMMHETIRELERSNRALLDQIVIIQEDLNKYRSELGRINTVQVEEPPEFGAHPLVPHGDNAE